MQMMCHAASYIMSSTLRLGSGRAAAYWMKFSTNRDSCRFFVPPFFWRAMMTSANRKHRFLFCWIQSYFHVTAFKMALRCSCVVTLGASTDTPFSVIRA